MLVLGRFTACVAFKADSVLASRAALLREGRDGKKKGHLSEMMPPQTKIPNTPLQ